MLKLCHLPSRMLKAKGANQGKVPPLDTTVRIGRFFSSVVDSSNELTMGEPTSILFLL